MRPLGQVLGESGLRWLILPWRRTFEFNGRSTRSELIGFHFTFVLLLALSMLIGERLTGPLGPHADPGDAPLTTSIFLLGLVPWFSVQLRRMHDTGRNGWSLLLYGLGPFGILFVWLHLLDAPQDGPNLWGGDPRQHRLVMDVASMPEFFPERE